MREQFRKEIQLVLDSHYKFYPMRSKGVNVEEYVKTHFRQLIGKVFTPFGDKEILTLALQTPADYANEEVRMRLEAEHAELMAMLEKDFTIQKDYQLGGQPQLPPKAIVVCGGADMDKKNVLTGVVREKDSNRAMFDEHKATQYVMESIPTINLMGVKYFLPMVVGKIDGFYEIDKLSFGTYKVGEELKPCLKLKLGKYINIGEQWVNIYNVMRSGEMISIEHTMNMYKGMN